jgi:hypothetical protein
MKVTNTNKPTLVFSKKNKGHRKQGLLFNKFMTPTNTLFVSGLFLVFVASMVAIFSDLFISSFLSISANQSSDFHPTSIPWLKNKSDCEHTGRIWSSGKCWDNEHNPMF